MITNEHSETLPSSCSSTSSSCSSSASTTGSSSISTLSSNHTGTNSSSTASTTSSPSTSNNNMLHPTFLNKQDQLAFDFHLIMSDLKTVCGTLSILAKQIDQIVNKMDDKFNMIIENLHQDELVQQNNKINSQRIVHSNNKTTKLSDLIKCTNNIESNSKSSSNSPPQLNSPNFFFSNNPSKPKPLVNGHVNNNNNNNTIVKPNYLNETILTNLINENYVNILNNQANKVNRSYSDRKPLLSYSNTGEDMKKNLNLSLISQQSNTTFINSNRETEILANHNSINGSIINRPNNQTFSFNAKPRCIRSKSQPAFNKTENLDYHTFILNNNNNNNKNSSKVTTTTTKTIIENGLDENKTAQTNESSFYEDQLDNELESFDNSSKLLLSNLNNNNKLSKKEDNKLTNNSISSYNNSGTGLIDNVKTPSLKSSTRTKSSNSNHHVSFNINNAIYTSKQETPIPIPISILKQTNKTNNEQKYSNLGNGPLNLMSFPSSSLSANATATATSMTTSPFQSLKKQNNYATPATILISEHQQQNLQLNSDQSQHLQSLRNLIANNNNNINNSTSNINNKNGRIDTKTTIL